jgi:hypothetical protein
MAEPHLKANAESSRELLRHTLATVAYRGGKALRGAPTDFDCFKIAQGTRTPGQLLAHICDLFDWALSMAKGKTEWHDTEPTWWDQDVARFHACLKELDDYLASGQPLGDSEEKLFQGPIADALTHIGQISMLRRLAGSPVKGESYAKAEITKGRVGSEQAAPRWEFD